MLSLIVIISIFSQICQGQNKDNLYQLKADYCFAGQLNFKQPNTQTVTEISDLNNSFGGFGFSFSRKIIQTKNNALLVGFGYRFLGNNLRVNTTIQPNYTYKIQNTTLFVPIEYQYRLNNLFFVNCVAQPGLNIGGGVSKKDIVNSDSRYKNVTDLVTNKFNLNAEVGVGMTIPSVHKKGKILINPKYCFFNNGIKNTNLNCFSLGIGVIY